MLSVDLDVSVPSRVRARRYAFDGAALAFAANAHAGFEIAWVDTGRLRYRVGSRVIDVDAGDVMLVPHGVEHANEFKGAPAGAVHQLRASSLHVDDSMIAALAEAAGVAVPREPGLLLRGADVSALGSLLLRELSSTNADARLCADALADAVVAKAVCAHDVGSVSSRDPRVRAAVDVIRARFADDIDVDDIARAAGTSRFHLSRVFKAATGKSPYQYLLHVRLDDAARSLRRGRRVTDAALSAGFADLSRFARMFRARFGVAPSAYSSTAVTSSMSTSPSSSRS